MVCSNLEKKERKRDRPREERKKERWRGTDAGPDVVYGGPHRTV
jgi:hypothetical protein